MKPSEEQADLDAAGIDPASIDTGQPIAQLADLEVTPTAGFLGSLKRRIERRQTAGELSGLFYYGPILVVVEFLQSWFEAFGHEKPDREPTDDPTADSHD